MQVWLLVLRINFGTPDQETIVIDYGMASAEACVRRGEAAEQVWLGSDFFCESTLRWEI